MTPDTIEKILDDPDTIIHLATALKEERQKRKALEAENEQQRQMIADFEPISGMWTLFWKAPALWLLLRSPLTTICRHGS